MGAGQAHPRPANRLWWPLYRSGAERRPLLSERRPHARLWTAGNRAAGEPPIAAAGRELSSILVGTVGTAAGAIERAGRSPRHHLRAAGRPAQAATFSTLSMIRKRSCSKKRSEF